MNIKIILLQKNIPPFFLQSIEEYKKRLSRYCKLKLILCKNENEVLKNICSSSYKISILNMGTTISSEQLAEKIQLHQVSGLSNITLIINSDFNNFDEALAMSSVHISPSLATTIVFEQIYRSYKILNNEPYHK
jgi:23S rRNA (pseudouridine1915-N3)-methyltransferase